MGNSSKQYRFLLMQLPMTPDVGHRLFQNYAQTVEEHGSVDLSLYREVCSGGLEYPEAQPEERALEDLFREFNEAPPEGYRGRSMSVSDVVYLWAEDENGTGKPAAWFCDSIGFTRICKEGDNQ